MEDSKALNIVSINLKGKTEIADLMIVASGTSSRHVNSIAENLLGDLRENGVKGIEPEGKETGEWVLIDIYDIIVHVMNEEARGKYDLENMWQVPVEKKRAASKATAGESTSKKRKATKSKPAKKPAAKKSAPKKRPIR